MGGVCLYPNPTNRSSIQGAAPKLPEVVSVDDAMGPILWTRLFLEAQGIEVKRNVLYQDNKSAELEQENPSNPCDRLGQQRKFGS